MLTRIWILLALTFSVPAFAESVDINTHQSAVSLRAPASTSQRVCLELTLEPGTSSQSFLENIEIVAGPGLDPQENQMPYLYRLIPEQASSTLVRFRGLQLTDRANAIEVRSKSSRSLAELAETHLNTKNSMILSVNPNCP